MILLRKTFVFHAYESLDLRLPERSIATLAHLPDKFLVPGLRYGIGLRLQLGLGLGLGLGIGLGQGLGQGLDLDLGLGLGLGLGIWIWVWLRYFVRVIG